MHLSLGNYPSIQLIQESFPIVSVVVAKLASEKVSRSLGELGGYLCSFAEETQNFSNEQKRALERDGRLHQVLGEVERAISWSNAKLTGLEYPSLRAIAAAQRAVDEGSREAVIALKATEVKIRASLTRRRINPNAIVHMLQICSDIKAGEELDSTDLSTNAKDDLPGYAKHAKTLHGVLSSYSSCSCPIEQAPGRHWARLRLKPVHELAKGNLVPFEMVFSASPNPSQTRCYEWQGIQILVPTKNASSRQVQFPQAATPAGSRRQDDIDNSEAVEGNFCSFISSKCGSLLCFKVDKGRLIALREPEDLPKGYEVRPDSGLRLGEVLEGFKMRHGMRPVLAYVLAKAMWHYYDSDWMNVSWTNDNIYFMNEIGDDEDITYFCKPYLRADLYVADERPSEYRQAMGMMHKSPRVLALGIMLIEIATGKPIGVEGHPDQWSPRTANEQLTSLRTLLKSASFEEDCRFPRYKTAIEKCLDPKLFKNAPFNPKRPEENLEQRRSIFYDEVVDPLRQLIEGTGWHTEFDEIERTPLVPKAQPRPNLSSSILALRSANGSPQASEVTGVYTKRKRDYWLEQITFINQRIKNESKRAGRTARLKIAILDTGYDENAPSFDIPGRLKRMKKWQDFVANSSRPTDSDGHGTHLVTLLLQTAPLADIFVARVAENSQGLSSAEDNINKAIRTAAVEWDADFVSMSFGFSKHVTKIHQAISDAVYHKKGGITFFAAAANDGLNSREMFPANLGESVISIRGTNRSGAFEPAFNPPKSTEEPAFGTLGVDVFSDWIGADSRRSMSGCSVATPVAVGIASMLFDYAASREGEFQPDDLRLMRTRKGIFELFREISIHSSAGRYYVAPFDLFNMSEDIRLAKMKAAIGRHPERW